MRISAPGLFRCPGSGRAEPAGRRVLVPEAPQRQQQGLVHHRPERHELHGVGGGRRGDVAHLGPHQRGEQPRALRHQLRGGVQTGVRYWDSTEQVYAYASAAPAHHRPAWSAFNRRARSAAGAVGIWHETFTVAPGAHESISVDAPLAGLAAATAAVPVGERSHSARQRMQRLGGA